MLLLRQSSFFIRNSIDKKVLTKPQVFDVKDSLHIAFSTMDFVIYLAYQGNDLCIFPLNKNHMNSTTLVVSIFQYAKHVTVLRIQMLIFLLVHLKIASLKQEPTT